VFVSITAHKLHLSGLLIVSAILLELSAELTIELGQIMLRHWKEEQIELYSGSDLASLDHVECDNLSEFSAKSSVQIITGKNGNIDSSIKRISSSGSMKRVASGNAINGLQNCNTSMLEQRNSSLKEVSPIGKIKRISSMGSMKRVASGNAINGLQNNNTLILEGIDSSLKKVSSMGSMKRVASTSSVYSIRRATSQCSDLSNTEMYNSGEKNDEISSTGDQKIAVNYEQEQNDAYDNSFKQRLLRGIKTILRSRLLMAIFVYNALYATTNVLLSFQRAELVVNRTSSVEASSSNSVDSNTAFLARINMASSVAVFVLQASGLGAFIGNYCGQRGTLFLMPIVRLLGVAILAWWHVKGNGKPPNLTLFLILDELTKVLNFAVAKPVRESLWSGLSNEARYEAKPIVDTLANRWGGGSAAFLMSLLDRIMFFTGIGELSEDGSKTLFGFPPILILCSVSAVWWAIVSADLGHIRYWIDMELKKQS